VQNQVNSPVRGFIYKQYATLHTFEIISASDIFIIQIERNKIKVVQLVVRGTSINVTLGKKQKSKRFKGSYNVDDIYL